MNREASLITRLIIVVLVTLAVGPSKLKVGAESLQSSIPSLPSGEGAWILKITTVDGRRVPTFGLNRRLVITSQGDTDGMSIYSCKPNLSPDELRTIAEKISSATPSAWQAWSDVHITDSCITTVSLARREAGGIEQTYNASWLCGKAVPPNMPEDLARVYESANALKDSVIKRCTSEYEQAVESLKRDVQTKPDDAGTQEQLGDLYAAGFRYEEAVAAYKQVVRLKPTDVEALSKLAQAYRDSDHDSQSIETYKELLRLEPKDAVARDAFTALGELYETSKQYREAVEAYKDLLQLGPKDERTNEWTNYQLGELYFKLGDYGQALKQLETLKNLGSSHMWGLYGDYIDGGIRVDQKDKELMLSLANAHYYVYKYERAIEAYKQVILLDPHNDLAYSRLGLSYLQLDRNEEAIQAFKQALELNPDDAGAYTNLGLMYDRSGRYGDAVSVLQEAIRRRPDDPESYSYLAWAYNKMDRYAEGLGAAEKSIQLGSKSSLAYNEMGNALLGLDRDAEAVEALREAVRIQPDNDSAQANLGTAYSRLEKYEEALEAFREAVRINPNDVATYSNLASTYNDMGRYKEAVEAARRAIVLQSDLPNPRRHLGYAYLKTGRYTEAVASLKEAVRLDPAYAEAHHDLGLAYLALHNRRAALKEYKTLQGLNRDLAKQLYKQINK